MKILTYIDFSLKDWLSMSVEALSWKVRDVVDRCVEGWGDEGTFKILENVLFSSGILGKKCRNPLNI